MYVNRSLIFSRTSVCIYGLSIMILNLQISSFILVKVISSIQKQHESRQKFCISLVVYYQTILKNENYMNNKENM